MPAVRIGTRGSKLALAQAQEVKSALEAKGPGVAAEIVIIKTTGDDLTRGTPDAPERDVKGMFVKELEEALLKTQVDIAVHSAKDMPTDLPAGLVLAAVLERRDPRDALIAAGAKTLRDLPVGAKVGAGSLRRQAQIKKIRRDLEFLPVRGNVDTRLRKLEEGQYDALVLASCGLERLGLAGKISERLDVVRMLPAPGQGAIGIEARADRQEILEILKAVNSSATLSAVRAERALLKSLGGGCQIPIGALAIADEMGNLTLDAAVFSPDGLRTIRQKLSGSTQEPERIGITLASHLRAKGADRILFGLKSSEWKEKEKWKKPAQSTS
ncbi:MAG: hydroxymethylbilane synthase [Candidatus Omnitrophica bacterium]|nr:hydroxymethylbilane synthase [Candidatus Omnitrophota bacterium]